MENSDSKSTRNKTPQIRMKSNQKLATAAFLLLLATMAAAAPIKVLPPIHIGVQETGTLPMNEAFADLSPDTYKFVSIDTRAHLTSATELGISSFDGGLTGCRKLRKALNPAADFDLAITCQGGEVAELKLNDDNAAEPVIEIVRTKKSLSKKVDTIVLEDTTTDVYTLGYLKETNQIDLSKIPVQGAVTNKVYNLSGVTNTVQNRVEGFSGAPGKFILYEKCIHSTETGSNFIIMLDDEDGFVVGSPLSQKETGLDIEALYHVTSYQKKIFFNARVKGEKTNTFAACDYHKDENTTRHFDNCQVLKKGEWGDVFDFDPTPGQTATKPKVLTFDEATYHFRLCDINQDTLAITNCLKTERRLPYIVNHDVYKIEVDETNNEYSVSFVNRDSGRLDTFAYAIKVDEGGKLRFEAQADRSGTAANQIKGLAVLIKSDLWSVIGYKDANFRIEVRGFDLANNYGYFQVQAVNKKDAADRRVVKISVNVYNSVLEALGINDVLPNFQAYSRGTYQLPLNRRLIAGNNLQFSVDYANNSKFEIVNLYSYDAKIDAGSLQGVEQIYMASSTLGIAIIPDPSTEAQKIKIINCDAQLKSASCTLSVETIPLQANERFSGRIYPSRFSDYPGAYFGVIGQASVKIYYIQDQSFDTITISGVSNINHVYYTMGGLTGQDCFFVLSSKANRAVYWYKMKRSYLKDVSKPTFVIDEQTTGAHKGALCPVEIVTCPKDDMFYEITSDCENDSRIIDYYIEDTTPDHQKDILLNNVFLKFGTDIKKCPTGEQFYIFSKKSKQIYSTSSHPDNSIEYLDLSEYGIDIVTDLQCSKDSMSFVVVGQSNQGQKKVGVFFGNQLNEFRSRVHSIVDIEDPEAQISTAYSLDLDRTYTLVAALSKKTGIKFYKFFLNGPQVLLTQDGFGKNTEGPSVVNVNIKSVGTGGKFETDDAQLQGTHVWDFNYTVESKATYNESDSIKQGEYVLNSTNITGPVFNISLKSNVSGENGLLDAIAVQQRVEHFTKMSFPDSDKFGGLEYTQNGQNTLVILGVSQSKEANVTTTTLRFINGANGQPITTVDMKNALCNFEFDSLVLEKQNTVIVAFKCKQGAWYSMAFAYLTRNGDTITSGWDIFNMNRIGNTFDLEPLGTDGRFVVAFDEQVSNNVKLNVFKFTGTKVEKDATMTGALEDANTVSVSQHGPERSVVVFGVETKKLENTIKGILVTPSDNDFTSERNFELKIPGNPFSIRFLNCQWNLNSETIQCVIGLYSNTISYLELKVEKNSANLIKSEVFYLYEDFESISADISYRGTIVVRTFSHSKGAEALLVYKLGNGQDLYQGLLGTGADALSDAKGMTEPAQYKTDYFLSTVAPESKTTTVDYIYTFNSAGKMEVSRVGDLKIDFTRLVSWKELNDVIVDFGGKKSEASLGSLFFAPDFKPSRVEDSKWWIWFLIFFGAVVAVLVIIMLIRSLTGGKKKESEVEGYKSIQKSGQSLKTDEEVNTLMHQINESSKARGKDEDDDEDDSLN